MNSLILLSAVIGAMIAGVVAYSILRNRIPSEVAVALAEAVARLRAQLSARDTESVIRLYAGALYDAFVDEGSALPAKIERQWFVDFCVRAIMRAQANGSADAEMVAMLVLP